MNSVYLSSITVLDISKNRIDMSDLLTCTFFKLQHLDLEGCFIDAIGCSYLSKSKVANNLTFLNMENNNIGSVGIQRLASGMFKCLSQLNLAKNQISSIEPLFTNIDLTKNLTTLKLHYNSIPNLTEQDLRQNFPNLLQIAL